MKTKTMQCHKYSVARYCDIPSNHNSEQCDTTLSNKIGRGVNKADMRA